MTTSSQQVISLAAGLAAYQAVGGSRLTTGGDPIDTGTALALSASFMSAFLILFWIDSGPDQDAPP